MTMVNDVVNLKVNQVKSSGYSSNRSKKTEDNSFQNVLDKTTSEKEKPIKENSAEKEPIKEQEEKPTTEKVQEDSVESKISDSEKAQVIQNILPLETIQPVLQIDTDKVTQMATEKLDTTEQKADVVNSVGNEQLDLAKEGVTIQTSKQEQSNFMNPYQEEPVQEPFHLESKQVKKNEVTFGNLEKQETKIMTSDSIGNLKEGQGVTLDNHFIASKVRMDSEQAMDTKSEQTIDLSNSVHMLNKVEQPQLNTLVPVSDLQKQQEIVLTNPVEMNQKLSEAMVKKILKDTNEFELQLEPANLGKLTIKVVYEAGKTAISIACTNPKSLEALAQQSKEIASIMEQKLGEPTVVIVDNKENMDYLQQERQHQNQKNQQQENNAQNHQTKQDEKNSANFLQQLRLGLM